jgi:hydrogenase nickel incorporation protein HypB
MNEEERSARAHHKTEDGAPHSHSDRPSGGRTTVELRENLLAANDRRAADVRSRLADHRIFFVNLLSSPGSGKTALLEATLARLATEMRIAVIEGDIETSADADRLAPFGIPVVQINTGPFGGDCHLAAPLVATVVEQFDLQTLDLLVVENVGNLVCPAEFDIGEDAKVVVLSVAEGEDKPLKYPLVFHESSLALISKVDLLPYLDVSLDLIRENVRRANPVLPVMPISARTGEGLEEWVAWLRAGVASKRSS